VIRYSFHPEAEAEFDDAALFYESRVMGLGRQFAAEVQRVVTFICKYPEAGARVRLPVRRALVDRFPYAVVYRRERESIQILAIAHVRKLPGYWRRRK
jgi:plasmid stabilization system protein ParE